MKSQRGAAITGFLLGAILSGIICFVVGATWVESYDYSCQFETESQVGKEVIASKPEFQGLHFDRSSDGTLVFLGTLPTAQSRKELEAVIIDKFGHLSLGIHMGGVSVAPAVPVAK